MPGVEPNPDVSHGERELDAMVQPTWNLLISIES